ncbi:MAG: hypothetical protein J0L50_09555 [Sphingomonadales bacterium]|nr:hypothetical protein [Sphingomonadales bacterium]
MPIRPIKPQGESEARPIIPPARARTRPTILDEGNPAAPEVTDPHQPDAEAGYTVGYGKPPMATRFKPGQSGNPKGRPKAAKGLGAIVRDTLTQKVAVRTAAGEKRISRIEAALHKTLELAMKGNPRALTQVIKLYGDAVPEAKPSVDAPALDDDLTATDLAMLEELGKILLAGEGQVA